MKYMIVLLILFVPLSYSFASELSEYENHYKQMNRLKGELETLELKKKIQKIEVEIYNSKQSLNVTKQETAIIKKNMEFKKINSGFDPNNVKLQYIIGSGESKKAVFLFDNVRKVLRNGSIYKGWRINIGQKEVTITKGSDVVKL